MKNNIEWTRYKELINKKPDLFKHNSGIEIIFDEDIVNDFELKNSVKIGVVYSSDYNYLIVDLVKSDNKLYTFERLIPLNSGSVVMVPKLENKFILLKQFRHSLRDMQYSFPRGFGEDGISSFENVKKELYEEIGAIPKIVNKIGEISPDSGILSNIVDVYYCEIEKYKKNNNHEGIVDIILLTEDELKFWIKEGKIIDNFTVSAYYLYLNNHTKI